MTDTQALAMLALRRVCGRITVAAGIGPSSGDEPDCSNFDVTQLAAGDSITFPCSRPHLIANRSATVTAIATWLIVNT